MNYLKSASVALLFLAVPFAAGAGMYGSFPNTAVLEKGVVENNDYYAVSENIDLAGDVMGDAVLAGGNVVISGTVGQDLLLAGGRAVVSGQVGDDMRAAGGTIVVQGSIGDDLVVAGGEVTVASSAAIKGDLVVAGGTVVVSAPVSGDVRVAGGKVTIDAPVSGSVYAGAGELVLGARALISGDLTYRSGTPAEVSAGAQVVGQTTYTETKWAGSKEERQGVLMAMFGMWMIVKIALLFGVGVLLHLLFGKMSVRFVEQGFARFWGSALRGLIITIVVPVVAIFGMVTVVGIPVSLVILALYGILLALGCIYAPIILGALLRKAMRRAEPILVNWKTILLGVVAGTLLGLVPIVGWIANALFLMVAVGVISKNEYDRFVAAR